ncbi:hypothetical protein CABS01_11439 [Colletotrichum abscissum]|uniref:Uncharacterized protein n=1 Tax=Colletotrichum abscissum TaxID=1671311 RepID=A0A9Q0B0J0_9PEZI|nr:uncharacterized protein CABS01_11439 [Colletotrichum abscissum]KAI3540272.1 hypothetical protein CABS02_11093 [Colletotrichum abscissum]KAK1494423.1 hypothetical protein CABS01_11439 [Colletotrichum abscissum]
MAPSPLHSLPSPTTTFKPILAAFTQPPTATPTTLITTVANLIPRTVTTVSVYITQVPSATAAPDAPKLKDPVYGNLTWTFIVVPCVPVIVLIFFVFTCYQERRRAINNMKKNPDIEMQTFHRFWFPWRELDKNEVPNEVSTSRTNPSSSHITLPPDARDGGDVGPGDAAAAASAAASTSAPETSGTTSPGILIHGEHPRRKKRRWAAWHPSDGTQIPPITLYENPPSWGRRHLWSEVMAYPSLLNPGLIRRRSKTPTNTKPDPADDTSSSSSYSSPPSPNASPPRPAPPRTAPPRTSPPRTPGGLPAITETESDDGDIATALRRPRFAEPTTRIIEPEREHGPGRDTNPHPSQIYGRTGRRRHWGQEDDHPREGQSSSSRENQTDTSDEGDTNNGSDNDENHSDADSITTQKPLRPPTDIPSSGRFKDLSSSTGTGTPKSTTTAGSSGTGTWAAGHIPSYYGASPTPAHNYAHQQQPSSSASTSATPTAAAAAAAAGTAALSRRAHTAASRASATNSDGVSPLSSARSSTVTVTGDARRRTTNTVSSIGSEPGSPTEGESRSPTRFGTVKWRSALNSEASSSSSGAAAAVDLNAVTDEPTTKTKSKAKGKGKAKAQPRSPGAKTDNITAKAKPKCTCKGKGKGKAVAPSSGGASPVVSVVAESSTSASASSSYCPRHSHQSHDPAVVEASQSTSAAPDTRDPAHKNKNKAHRRSVTEWPRVCSGCGQVG